MALIGDEMFQSRFDAEYSATELSHGASALHLYTVIDTGSRSDLASFVGMTVADIAAVRNEGPMQTLMKLGVETNLQLQLKSPLVAARDPSQGIKLMSHPAVTVGVSDGGAHTKSNALGHYGTDLLVWLVRDQKVVTLEEMHFQLSLKAAQSVQIRDRGAIVPGFWADLVIYDLANLYVDTTRMSIIHDMPDGDWRRKTRAGGYSHILVNGVITHIADEPTGATPGQFVQVTARRSAPLPSAAE